MHRISLIVVACNNKPHKLKPMNHYMHNLLGVSARNYKLFTFTYPCQFGSKITQKLTIHLSQSNYSVLLSLLAPTFTPTPVKEDFVSLSSLNKL